MLWHSVTVYGEVATVTRFEALMPPARHPMPARRAMSYRVRRVDAGYEVREEGDVLVVAATVEDAADAIYVRVWRRAFELASLDGWSRVHAATVDVDGTRVLLVGPSGVGKTTLALRMLFDGHAVQGDESVLVKGGASIAAPRGFHVKHGTVDVVPELGAVATELPETGDVLVLDPSCAGRAWELTEAPVGHVVRVEGRSDQPRCERVPLGDVLEALVAEAFVVTESKAELVARLTSAVARSGAHRLQAAAPGATIMALREALH